MSQQQINYRSIDRHLSLAQKSLEKQADLYYTQKHFKVGNKYDRAKFLHAQLYVDILCTEDCDIINWLDKKERGILEDNIVVKKLDSLEQEKRDIYNTNNYYYSTATNWQEISW